MKDNDEIIEPFKVYVKIRPLTEKEKLANHNKKTKKIVIAEENLVFVLDPESQEFYVRIKLKKGKKEKNFVFDSVFTEKESNKTIFETIVKDE